MPGDGPAEVSVSGERRVRLFKMGRNQAVRIPREFEFPGEDAIMRKEDEKLFIGPVRRKGLAALPDNWEPLGEEFPEIEDPPPAISFRRRSPMRSPMN